MMKKNKLILNRQEIIDILEKEYKNLANIFSDKVGIVNAMLERHELDKYNLFMYQCLSANVTKLFDLNREVSSGGLGVHEDKKTAMISCLAEALERYCMSFIPKGDLIICRKRDLNKKYVFQSFYTYNKNQYNQNKNFLDPNNDIIEWTKIVSVNNKNNFKYWPASLIYLPYEVNSVVAETTSTGMAAGFDINECIGSGLMELIERDSLMINFMQRLNPPEINLDTISGINQKLISTIKKEYNIKIYQLYSDIDVPIYLSIIYKENNKDTHYGIGACANVDSDYAINKSLKECLFTYFYSLNIMDAKVENPNNIKALYEHFLYYQGNNFKDLLFDSKIIKYERKKTSLKKVIENLKSKNIDVFYKELTTDDIKETKIRVLKVIAPGLIDMHKSHTLPRLGADRYWSVPQKLGLKYFKELCDKPHPFP